MIVQFRPGASIPQTDGALIETERLKLRRWRETDIAPNTQMLSDPDTARFITSDGKPITDEFVGWRNSAIMAGHWGAARFWHVRGRGEGQRKIYRAGGTLASAELAGV
jgi:RimJ/RimL family protein N-acetyltransferase